MAQLAEDGRQRLVDKIKEWNDHRWDLFELSIPNEELEFHGVMRFYFQDPVDQQQTTTKCIRVSSTASVRDVVTILIEKFRPDMRLLGSSNYTLYEVHGNGDERMLQDSERPLLIQLNWNEEARDGRFLLKNEDERTSNMTSMVEDVPPGGFKRKLSKREKKEQKKREKEAKLKGKENETPNKGSVAEKLYNELPETSFTRSISNPEAVMRRRRQQKLEKKLQQFKSRDGGPDSGGTLKIYGEQLRPDVPYKTLLLSVADTTLYVVKETLEKYSLEKEDPNNYCLVQRILGLDNEYHGGKEYVLDDEDCPLAILMNHPPSKGTVMFYLRRRTADMPKKRKKKNKLGQDELYGPFSGHMNRNALPYLLELTPDGLEPPQAKKLLLPLNVTEVGSQRSMSGSGQYLLLYAPDIHPRHCVIAHTEGIVTVTPTSKDADTYVENQHIFDTTLLQHGMIVRFGKTSNFRFLDPQFEEKIHGRDGMPVQGGPPPYEQKPDPRTDPRTMETSFDVDGHVETVANTEHFQKMAGYQDYDGKPQDVLPAVLEFREDAEPEFLTAVVTEVNGGAVQFKLAPTYTLYMAARYRISHLYRPDMPPQERNHRLALFLNQTASMIQHTIQENRENAGALSFWMANASELLHFVKQDEGLGGPGLDAQDYLAEAVQVAFRYLVHCMQLELRNTMVAFLDDADHDLDDDGEYLQTQQRQGNLLSDVLQVLSSAMSLLRRCRVNAALTIQLFSQLFHYINMWLFNKLVLEPRLGLCTRVWGHRLKRRLGRVEIWAEKQGLELAADCHLARIIQAAHLLQAPKSSPDDIASISSTCFKLNSLQLHALLYHYIPGPGEPRIPHDLIDSVVKVAKNTADELTRSDGREVRLEEEPDLQLPFLLPEDGYSCDIVRGVPNGLAEFLDPLLHAGICRLTIQQQASGLWTVYMNGDEQENLRGMQSQPGPAGDPHTRPVTNEPEVIHVTFDKVNGSMGLSIVAAKGEGQEKRGIYIKSVVPGGAAALDGRLRPGDQLLEVDGKSLIGLTQEKAAELMTRTGHTVHLTVGKQGAIYHGLGALLNTPSPVLPRGSPRRSQGAGGKGLNRPKSEDVARINGPQDGGPGFGGGPHPGPGYDLMQQRPLQQQMGARSSPALSGARSHEQLREPVDGYGAAPFSRPSVLQSQSYHDLGRPGYGADPNLRSKSTSNLDTNDNVYPDSRQGAPGRQSLQRALERPGSHPELHHPAEQPDLRWVGGDYDRDYENYPGPQSLQGPQSLPPQVPGYGSQRPGQMGAPLQPHQPNYVNHQQIREYGQYGAADTRNAVSTPNLHDEYSRPDMRAKSAEVDHSRVTEWQKQNEMDRWGQRAPGSQPGQPPTPQSPYSLNTGYPNMPLTRNREATPPFDPARRQVEPEPQSKAGTSSQNKPSTPSRPQQDPRYDPRMGAGQFSPSSQYPPGSYPPSHHMMPPHSAPYGTSPAETRTVYSHGKEHFPPPPDEDLPPPPPPPPASGDLQQQIRQEEENMMRRMAGLDPYRDPGRDPRSPPDNRLVSSQQQPEPQRPSPPGGYQPAASSRPGPQYPYQPQRDEPGTPLSRDPATTKRPPIAVKPKVMPKPNLTNPPSPWERAEKERMEKEKAEEMTSLRDQEIAELEDKPYLTGEEQERLRRLRLDQEFDRRVKEASKTEDDEEADSDTDIIDRPAGRAVLFRQMQEDLKKKSQQIVEGRIQRDREAEKAERDKMERQDRRLAQFEQEREEQKQRQMKRQEKQEREAEAYLNRQRELRERQRREQEEQARKLRQEEEQRREMERQDLRRKREMEKEQLRDMSLRNEDQYSYEYRAQPAPPAMVPPPPQPGYPPPQPPERRTSYEVTRHHNLRNSMGGYEPQTPRSSASSALRPPADLTPSSGKKSVSFNSNLAVEINENQIPYGSTSSETSLMAEDGPNNYRPAVSSPNDQPNNYRPAVSGPSDQLNNYRPAVSGPNDQPNYRPAVSAPNDQLNNYRSPNLGPGTDSQNNYRLAGHGSSEQQNNYRPEPQPPAVSDPGPAPFQRAYYGPGRPPQPTEDNVFEQRTPTNQGIPATLVAGPTPGVVGAQEFYRDPRDRIAAQKAASSGGRGPGPERMSFRDKMSMFAREAGEDHTPKDRQKASRAQRVIETDLNGQSVA